MANQAQPTPEQIDAAVEAGVADIEARGYRMATHIALEAVGALRDPRILAARLAHRLDECEREGRYNAADRCEIAALGGQADQRAMKLRRDVPLATRVKTPEVRDVSGMTVLKPAVYEGVTRAMQEAEHVEKMRAKREKAVK